MGGTIKNVATNLLIGSICPLVFFILYCIDIVTCTTFKLLIVIFIVIFVIFPLIFRYSYKLQSHVVFLNFVRVPSNADYKHPSAYGLDGARNFYLSTNDNVTLGVWQILPENLVGTSDKTDEYFEKILGNCQDVIIYHHGNAGTRLTDHRVQLYKVLRKHFHVIAFDYRSYGDSSNVEPSEDNLVRDSVNIYEWVSHRTTGRLFIWGHSLGTSIAIQSMANLQRKGSVPAGVILEAPFNNMKEEISKFPLAKIFRNLPWFSYTVIQPMQENGFTFKTDQFICEVDAPILILHAEDDHVVPFSLGYKLYEAARRCRTATQGKIEFHPFDKKYGYDHKFIYRAPELPEIIMKFVDSVIPDTQQHNYRG
ncbi:lysophosphatidylserine lipase ABHD12 isoform X2 [Leptinotarsa decemlineata]|uniref:lysophosphatidylserine lipase ABHD12 isoform X2 n=1 Tax=Leptinotarsa decemlineata TaxID=7539 RepID=UPI003D305E51